MGKWEANSEINTFLFSGSEDPVTLTYHGEGFREVCDGDLVVVDLKRRPNIGDIVVVGGSGEKQLTEYESNRRGLYLVGASPAADVLGVVTHVIHKTI